LFVINQSALGFAIVYPISFFAILFTDSLLKTFQCYYTTPSGFANIIFRFIPKLLICRITGGGRWYSLLCIVCREMPIFKSDAKTKAPDFAGRRECNSLTESSLIGNIIFGNKQILFQATERMIEMTGTNFNHAGEFTVRPDDASRQGGESAFAIAARSQYARDSGVYGDAGRNRRGLRRGGFAALMLAGCIGASSLFGFIGGYVANNTGPVFPAVGETQELPQFAIRTVAADNAPAAGMTVAETAAMVKETVVEITTETVSGGGRMVQFISTGAGSGVIVSADGHIVTNNHVISGAQNITVRLNDGSEYAAEIKGMDSKTDLAVLKINAPGLTPAVFGDSSALSVGDPAVVIGNPLGELGGTVTSGIISALDREITIDGAAMSLLQTDAAVNPGNSGGGMFNLRGELIGVVNAKSSGSGVEGLGFAIPSGIAKTVITELIENGYVRGRVSLGITVVDVQDTQTAMMYRLSRLGLYITRSSNPQLKSGDRITELNGVGINGLADLNAAMMNLTVGSSVNVTVVRDGQNVTVPVTLSELRS
jgi:serine protease Do